MHNALQHSGKPEAELIVALGCMTIDNGGDKPKRVCLFFEDNGKGVPIDQRSTIFRPFHTGAAGGTGLGLNLAQDILRQMRAEFTLDPEFSGGARFLMLFSPAGEIA